MPLHKDGGFCNRQSMARSSDSTPSPNIGPDGTVYLRAYLPVAHIHWFSIGCNACQHMGDLSVPAAIRLMGSADATTGEVLRRLRCSACGAPAGWMHVAVDPRTPEVREREGPHPGTRAGL